MKTFATAVAVSLLGASLAFAAPHEGGKGFGGHGKHGYGAKFAQELNLTDAQKAQIKTLKQESREQNKAFFEQARATRKELRAARKAGDTAKLDALKANAQSQRAQFKQIREAEQAKIASILTAEQNAKLQQLKADRPARHANHTRQ